MKIYLGGPMTAQPEFNFPLFHEVAAALRAQGHDVANPAEHDLITTPAIKFEPGYKTGDTSKTRLFDSRTAFVWDFGEILKAHAIVLLPGWEASTGARMERLVAEKTGKLVLLAKKKFLSAHGHTDVWSLEPDPIQVQMNAVIQL